MEKIFSHAWKERHSEDSSNINNSNNLISKFVDQQKVDSEIPADNKKNVKNIILYV